MINTKSSMIRFTLFILVAFVLCITHLSTTAQVGHTLTGTIIDTVDQQSMQYSPVSILRATDSILVKFGRAGKDGRFHISGLETGVYLLWITNPDYADYLQPFTLDSTTTAPRDFGSINMMPKSYLLEEVVINAVNKVRKVGDTTEYNIAGYVVEPNAKVEDLLVQFPGIQVDQFGNIRANGQRVERILLDGEEFFGDDPLLITRNIRGDMVDKIQLYDAKSEFATMTGLDDGLEVRTINVLLKEDKKVGYFGQVDAGIAPQSNYSLQAMANFFKRQSKFAAFETINNIGGNGPGLVEMGQYGFNFNAGNSSVNAIVIKSEFVNQPVGAGYNGDRGVPETKRGGLHFDTKWRERKESVNSDYSFSSLTNTGGNNEVSYSNLPGNLLRSYKSNNFVNNVLQHRFNAAYKAILDSISYIELLTVGNINHFATDDTDIDSSFNSSDAPIYESERIFNNDGSSINMDFRFNWYKTFKRPGHNLIISVYDKIFRHRSAGLLRNNVKFFNTDTGNIRLNQQKRDVSTANILGIDASYLEPFHDKLYGRLNYSLGYNTSQSRKETVNTPIPALDSLYSNGYTLRQLYTLLGPSIYYRAKKTQLDAGVKMSVAFLHQLNQFTDESSNATFINWLPEVNYRQDLLGQGSLNIGYRAHLMQPTLEQMQDVEINIDPLNVLKGNPDITPALDHRLEIGFSLEKMVPIQSFTIKLTGDVFSNALVNEIDIDEHGLSRFQLTNVKEEVPYSLAATAEWFKQLKSSGLNVIFSLNSSMRKFYSIVNGHINETFSQYYFPKVVLSKWGEQVSFDFHIGPQFQRIVSMLDREIQSNANGFSTTLNLSFSLPGKISVTTMTDYKLEGRSAAFGQRFSRLLFNASIEKKLLVSEQLTVAVRGFDLFNQNTGFRRFVNRDLITQYNYNTLRRYVLFAVSYDFNRLL